MTKFSTSESAASSSSSSSRGAAATGGSTGTKSISKTEPVYAGGIFSRLEAQFRAQQAARALTLQSTQTRCVHTHIHGIVIESIRHL